MFRCISLLNIISFLWRVQYIERYPHSQGPPSPWQKIKMEGFWLRISRVYMWGLVIAHAGVKVLQTCHISTVSTCIYNLQIQMQIQLANPIQWTCKYFFFQYGERVSWGRRRPQRVSLFSTKICWEWREWLNWHYEAWWWSSRIDHVTFTKKRTATRDACMMHLTVWTSVMNSSVWLYNTRDWPIYHRLEFFAIKIFSSVHGAMKITREKYTWFSTTDCFTGNSYSLYNKHGLCYWSMMHV